MCMHQSCVAQKEGKKVKHTTKNKKATKKKRAEKPHNNNKGYAVDGAHQLHTHSHFFLHTLVGSDDDK